MLNPVSYFGFGWLGVPLFFVLSGYLLGSKVIDQRLNRGFITRFWRRRLLRIYPAVWFHLLVLLALRKFGMEAAADVGDKSVFAYLDGQLPAGTP